MKMKWMLLGAALLPAVSSQAVVKVTDVVAAQRPGTKLVDISYSVSSSNTNAVSVTLKVRDGAGDLGALSVTGDVGAGVATGSGKSMVWNAAANRNGVLSPALEYWILVSDGTESTPLPASRMAVVSAGTNSGTDPDNGAYSLALTNNLYVDSFEVTKSLWDSVAGWASTNGYVFEGTEDAESNNHPVVGITWYDALKWCNARSQKEGLAPCYTVGGIPYKTGNQVPEVNSSASGYRLPTAIEWEYCARGGLTDTRFPWGNTITHSQANYYSVAGLEYDLSPTRGWHPLYDTEWLGTAPVGAFAPNGYGLFEMAGNAAEWCWNADAQGTNRYRLGGDWLNSAKSARCTDRFAAGPSSASFSGGFRTVRLAGNSVSGTAAGSVDTRDFTLRVVSPVGSPNPAAGLHTYAWGATVVCSVEAVATAGGVTFVSQGWTGTGSIPATGTTNTTGAIMLTDVDSSITWRWLADDDRDTLPNEWERTYFGSSTGAVANADSDGDGYSNLDELRLGTDPTSGTSQLNFAIAVSNGVTIVSCATVPGRTYFIEYTESLTAPVWFPLTHFAGTGATVRYSDYGASTGRYYRMRVELVGDASAAWPWKTDADADALPDEWELAYFGSKTAAVAGLDSDGDGYSNLEELYLGTDPTSQTSHLHFSVASSNGTQMLSCATVPGRLYFFEYANALVNPVWLPLATRTGTGGTAQYTDASATSPRYYRIRVVAVDVAAAW